ncbi:MAG: methyl-accepting chemotaxis protein [Armatimonadota bacterium]
MAKYFANLKLAQKFALSFGIVLALQGLLGLAGFRGFSEIQKQLDLFKTDVVPGTQAASEMNDTVMGAHIQLERFVSASPQERSAIKDELFENVASFKKGMKDYDPTITVSEDRKNFTELKARAERYLTSLDQLVNAASSGAKQESLVALLDKSYKLYSASNEMTDAIVAWNTQHGFETQTRAAASGQTAVKVMWSVLFFAVAVAVVAGLLLTKSIVTPVKHVADRLSSISNVCAIGLEAGVLALKDGDLTYQVTPATTPIPNPGKDELGQMASTFNDMLAKIQRAVHAYNDARLNLSKIINGVAQSSEVVSSTSSTVAAASEEISATSSEISAGSDQLASNASEVAVIVEELHAQVLEVGQSSERQANLVEEASTSLSEASRGIAQVDEAAKEMATSAATGNKAVAETVAAMGRLKEQIEFSATKVQELDAAGQKIGDIVKTIDSIAAQTNLLALNAAIEAARAGEHGRGFAVVADEVRKLAEQSSLATKEIGGLIGSVRSTVKETVEAIQTTSNEAEDGVKRSTLAGEALKEILDSADKVKTHADQVAKVTYEATTSMENVALAARDNLQASQEMTQGTERVTHAITNVAAIAEEAAAGASEMTKGITDVSESAANLSLMSGDLQEAVSKFKIDPSVTTTKFEIYENKAA